MRDLNEIRSDIESIDKEMAGLFEKRMKCSVEIADYKSAKGIPIFDPEREKALIKKNEAYIDDEDIRPYYIKFMQDIMDISKLYQHKLIDEKKTERS